MEKSYTASAIRKRAWRNNNPEKYLKSNRENTWKILGLDVKQASLLRETIKQCQICNREENLHVDHCHSSMKIRGMLCRDCNVGLGNFKDDKQRLFKAIDYLDKSVYN